MRIPFVLTWKVATEVKKEKVGGCTSCEVVCAAVAASLQPHNGPTPPRRAAGAAPSPTAAPSLEAFEKLLLLGV